MPAFYRQQLISGVRLKVIYADDNPGRLVAETPTAEEIAGKPQDGVFGAAAVEMYLDTKLQNPQ